MQAARQSVKKVGGGGSEGDSVAPEYSLMVNDGGVPRDTRKDGLILFWVDIYMMAKLLFIHHALSFL